MLFRNRRGRSASAIRRLATGHGAWLYLMEGNGPPLVLIHGLSGSTGWWRRNIPALAARYTVYAVELHGFGANRGRVLPLSQNAAALVELMDALELPHAHVIGHSMGGQISLHLAAEYPQRVDGLVLVAPSGLLRKGILRMALRLPLATRYGALDFTPTLLSDALRAGPRNLLTAAFALLQDDVEALLAQVCTPTLVIAGERDMLVPAEVCATIAAGIEGARYVELAGAGHNVMWDRAGGFNELVLAFLAELDEQAGRQLVEQAPGNARPKGLQTR